MQFQVQQLVDKKSGEKGGAKAKEDLARQKNSDELDLFAGVHTGLDDPYNVFLRVKDITAGNPLIYFYGYSMGKKKVVMWGVYDVHNNTFLIDAACRYNPNNLKQMLDVWKANRYQYSFNSVRNRIDSRIREHYLAGHFGQAHVKNLLNLFQRFKDYLLVKLVKEGYVNRAELLTINKGNENLPYILDILKFEQSSFDDEYDYTIDEVKKECVAMIETGELDFRLSYDIIRFHPFFDFLFNSISNTKDETAARKLLFGQKANDDIKTSSLSTKDRLGFLRNFVDLKASNFSAFTAAKYIMINYFVLIFSNIEEYRSAKYILAAKSSGGDKAAQERLERTIKGLFLYEWILELGNALQVSDIDQFIIGYATEFVSLMEDTINRTDTGVIGGRAPPPSDLVKNLAKFFEEFVAKSMYSKITLTNDLGVCPNPDVCELNGQNTNEACNLYSHGASTNSKHDLT